MRGFGFVTAGLMLALLLWGGPFPALAQQGGKKGEAQLTQKEQLANTALFVDAVKERLNENYDLAEEMLHRVISKEPLHDAAHYELAILLVMKGRIQEALQEARAWEPDGWGHLQHHFLSGESDQDKPGLLELSYFSPKVPLLPRNSTLQRPVTLAFHVYSVSVMDTKCLTG